MNACPSRRVQGVAGLFKVGGLIGARLEVVVWWPGLIADLSDPVSNTSAASKAARIADRVDAPDLPLGGIQHRGRIVASPDLPQTTSDRDQPHRITVECHRDGVADFGAQPAEPANSVHSHVAGTPGAASSPSATLQALFGLE